MRMTEVYLFKHDTFVGTEIEKHASFNDNHTAHLTHIFPMAVISLFTQSAVAHSAAKQGYVQTFN